MDLLYTRESGKLGCIIYIYIYDGPRERRGGRQRVIRGDRGDRHPPPAQSQGGQLPTVSLSLSHSLSSFFLLLEPLFCSTLL